MAFLNRPHFLLLATLFLPAYAHQQPTTLVVLDVTSDHVAMKLHVPLSELELAFGHDVSQPRWDAPFRDYLVRHIRPVTEDGRPWSIRVIGTAVQAAEQTQTGTFQEIVADLVLSPPAGASLRQFVLHYDVIMHQVVTHRALVSLGGDWESGRAPGSPIAAGTIQVNTETSQIAPFPVRLAPGSWWTGFTGMIRLGMQHIKEGTDHVLFLLVLLLPATLTVDGARWGTGGGSHYSLVRLVKIVTAFTAGHSATLLAGALGWLRLPQQPVEVLIACSILVSAIHAVRPIFPNRETWIVAGFGLIHGLAFATALEGLRLSAGPLALSILGFNLGIELMQLLILAFTAPWIVLLSLTPVFRPFRIAGALAAAVAATGWIANRVSGQPNELERMAEALPGFAPLGILLLALLAIPSYLFTNSNRGLSPQFERQS